MLLLIMTALACVFVAVGYAAGYDAAKTKRRTRRTKRNPPQAPRRAGEIIFDYCNTKHYPEGGFK